MILKADETVSVGQHVLLSELHGGVRLSAIARVTKTDGLHRPVAQCVNAAPRQLFNRQTRLKPSGLLEALERNALGVDESIIEARVIFFIKRAVQIIVAALVITRGAKGHFKIDRVGGDYRRDSIVEVKLIVARQTHDLRCESF